MANIPQLISKEQLIGLIIDSVLSRIPDLNDLNQGSTIAQLAESVGQVVYRPYADIISMVSALSVDRAVGAALQRQAADANVPIFPALPASGFIDITDQTFQKVQSSIYAGQPAPVAGSLIVYVSDATAFLPSGTIYMGRGTSNVEGPLTYTSITALAGGTYFALNLNAATPTAKFHNIGETVIMGQGGNRSVPIGTTVSTPQGSSISSVNYITTVAATILDGETTVTNIPMVAQQTGTIGNVPRGAIQTVSGLPFNATASNEEPLFNGRPADSEDDIRDRIKEYEQLKAKGTPLAIQAGSLDVVSTDDLQRVTSANTVSYPDTSAALVFDNGSGYEPLFYGVGVETVVDQAVGGEQNLQFRKVPTAQALIESGQPFPYNIPNLYELSVTVNAETTVHQFLSTDFAIPGAATAFEVAASINGASNLNYSANTSRGGTRVVVFPKDPNVNNILVNTIPSMNANDALQFFADNIAYTARVYKNDTLLFQDGLLARVSTESKQSWSIGIIAGDTLTYQVDSTPPITATFTLTDFQEVNPSATVSSSESIDVWAQVFNNLMPGVNATVDGDIVHFDSNRGFSSSAKLSFTGGTLLTKIFPLNADLSSTGQSSDYTFNRQTSQIGLVEPLAIDDRLSVGSAFTRAKLLSSDLPSGVSSSGNVWFVVDGNVTLVPSNMRSTTQLEFTVSGTEVTLHGRNSGTLAPEGFDQVQVGDWLLIWTNPTDDPSLIANAGFWRVESVNAVGSITYSNNTGANSGWISGVPINRIVFVRSPAPIQRLSFSPQSLVALVTTIQTQILGVSTSIIGSQIRMSTETSNSSGQLVSIAADTNGQAIGFPISVISNNTTSHLGFNVTDDLDYGFPSFTFSDLTSVIDPTHLEDNVNLYPDLGGDGYDYLEFLDTYSISLQTVIPDSNIKRRDFVSNYNTSTDVITTITPNYMQANASLVQAGDRYFIRKSYQFDSDDTLSVVVDGNTAIQTFNLPVDRKLSVSNASIPTLTSFSATDKQSSLALNDPNSFNAFSFLDFKAWRRAHAELTDGVYDMLAQFSDFGPSGNFARIGILYPDNASETSITHNVKLSDVIDIGIVLPVETVRAQTWDGTSSFTVAVTTLNGMDTVVYTWRVGTQPNFGIAGSNLSIGDVAMIASSSDFESANSGISAKVTNFTATSFTIIRPTGTAQSDALSFDNIQNINGLVTITILSGHNIQNGDKVGIYDTAQSTPGVYPLNNTYIPTIVSPTVFTVHAPAGTPGGVNVVGTHSGNVVTINAPAHGLSVGNFIIVSGVSISAYNGTFRVFATPSVNQFQYIVAGSSASIANDGRFDFQSFAASTPSASITSLQNVSGTVTVTTTAPHGFSSGDLVEISGDSIDAWLIGTTYGLGDVVFNSFDSLLYKSLQAGNVGNPPQTSPTFWQVTTFDLTGTFVITVTGASTFTYAYQDTTGTTNATGGSSTKYVPAGKLARSLGSSSQNLNFTTVGTTVQAILDYASNNLVDQLLLSSLGSTSALVDTSTEDLNIGTNYLFGNVTDIRSIDGSRSIDITVDTQVDAGASITIDVTASAYDGKYVVLTSTQSGSSWILRCYSDVLAFSTGSVAGGSGTYTGSYPYLIMVDGENSVLSQNLSVPPNFTLKHSWVSAPTINEEIRLVVANKEQLVRFWNKLIVSGISNLTSVQNSKYGEEIQIETDTFGSTGSIQMLSSLANDGIVALNTTASQIDSKLGTFGVPYELRKGIIHDSWLKLTQVVAQDKFLGLNSSTQIKVHNDGLELINNANGSFQTKRTSDHDHSTMFRVEQHGKFFAFIAVSGSLPNYGTHGIQEGDWVRIQNTLPQLYNTGKTYLQGNKVKLNDGSTYVAVQNVPTSNTPPNLTYWAPYSDYSSIQTYSSNTALGNAYASFAGRIWQVIDATPFTDIAPGTDNTKWRVREWAIANNGIFQVVRTFGQTSFWIEGSISEEITQILDPNDLSFYSYDSVMPGDTLSISGNILGNGNIGMYTVLDDASDATSLFPTDTRIYTKTIPLNSGSSFLLLGNNFDQVQIIEKAPIVLYKHVSSVGPGLPGIANVVVDSPNLINKISNSLNAYLTMENKLNYNNLIQYGIDGYKFYGGLLKQLNRVIYGDPTSDLTYPGIRAAGANVDIKPALIKRIELSISIRIKIGLSFTEIQDRVKASIAGYVNQLPVGAPVALSGVVSAAGSVNGVTAVSIVSPTYTAADDQIAVGADQTAKVVNPQNDIIVSIVGN